MQINSVKSDARQDVFFSAGIFVHQFSIEVCISLKMQFLWKNCLTLITFPTELICILTNSRFRQARPQIAKVAQIGCKVKKKILD